MPVHYLAQCLFTCDTAFPRDKIILNPCFRDNGVSSNPQGLADSLRDGLKGWWVNGASKELTVKLYDLQGSKPVYPAATSVSNAGATPAQSAVPRELAVCLSFYGGHPEPSKRGRIFVPYCLAFNVPTNLNYNVSVTVSDKVDDLVPIFAGLGGVDVDWIVWSRKNRAATKVDHWWIDNEWDTVRKRGLRSTSRVTGTTSG